VVVANDRVAVGDGDWVFFGENEAVAVRRREYVTGNDDLVTVWRGERWRVSESEGELDRPGELERVCVRGAVIEAAIVAVALDRDRVIKAQLAAQRGGYSGKQIEE
jgi:hypothetical protein